MKILKSILSTLGRAFFVLTVIVFSGTFFIVTYFLGLIAGGIQMGFSTGHWSAMHFVSKEVPPEYQVDNRNEGGV